MTRTITILLLFLSCSIFGQDTPLTFKKWARRNIIGWSMMAVSGTADGMVEVLRHDYPAFKRTFSTNDQFWNPEISCMNKYKNHDPAQGEKFFLSTTSLVFVTDGYHLLRTVNHVSMFAAITIKVGGPRQKWYWYALDFISYSLVYTTAFNITYETIRK